MIRVPVAEISSSDAMLPAFALPVRLQGIGVDWGNIANVITAGAGGASQIINATRNPFVIPGSGGVIYTPANQQVSTAGGVTAQNVGVGMTPLLIIAGIGMVLILTMKK